MKDAGQSFVALLAQARAAYEDAREENGIYWEIVWLLANRGDRITLDQTLPLTRGDVFERGFAASILGPFAPRFQFDPAEALSAPKRFASQEIIDVLLNMLETESDEIVLIALVSSLGQHQELDGRIPAALGRFVGHHNLDIRWSLAVALGRYKTAEATAALGVLAQDRDANVRDWAAFGLGRRTQDPSETFRSLFAALEEEREQLRAQAVDGLGLRDNPLFNESTTREFYTVGDSEETAARRRGLLTSLSEMTVEPFYRGDQAYVPLTFARFEQMLQGKDAPLR